MSLNSEHNKHRIINATFALSLKHGFDNVSIKQIQEESGLASGSIYYHFKDKDEILDYMIKTYMTNSFYSYRDDIKNFEGTFIEKLKFILEYVISGFATKSEPESLYIPIREQFDHKEYFTLVKSIYHHHPKVRSAYHKLNEKLFGLYYEVFQEAIENKQIREDIDIKTLVIFFQTILKGYTDMWTYQPNISIEEIIDANIKMIDEAIKKS